MESPQSDAKDVVLRYLTGRLTPEERDAFERALPTRPELREETEQVLKFREGLARLRDRGELDELLCTQARSWVMPYAAAAALAIISLVALAWFYLGVSHSNLLALSPEHFVSAPHSPPAVAGSYALTRTRGSASVTELPRVGVIELRVPPSSVLSSAVRYRAEIREGNGTSGRTLGQLDAGRVAADGYVTFYLDSGRLTPGDYEVRLVPSIAGGPDAEADRFLIRVR